MADWITMMLLGALLFAGLSFCQLNKQVSHIYQFVDPPSNPLPLGYVPGQYYPALIGPGSGITPDGYVTCYNNSFVYTVYNGMFDIQRDEESHFSWTLSMNMTGATQQGGKMIIGNILDNSAVAWRMDGNTTFALIFQELGNWAIPLANHDSTLPHTYTIVFQRSNLKISFLIDGVLKLTVPGSCGIDPRFRTSLVSTERCSPIYTPDNFPKLAQPIMIFGEWLDTGNHFCYGDVYDNCIDSISYAAHCNCDYRNSTHALYNSTVLFQAQIYQIQMFGVETAQRCPFDDSSSSARPWWRIPYKNEEEDDNKMECSTVA